MVLGLTTLLFADIESLQRLYDQKEYRKAIEKAKNQTEDYSNPLLHLIWARSAKALKKNSEAMSAYERAYILAPHNTQLQQELIALYLLLKKNSLANQILKKTNQSTRASSDSSNAQLRANFSQSLGYDSNVNIQNKSSLLNEFYNTTEYEDELKSSFYLVSANLEYLYSLSSNIYLTASLNGYYKMLLKHSDYSLYLNNIKLGLGYYNQTYNVLVPLSYLRLHYLGETYLDATTVAPQVDIKLNEHLIMRLNSHFEKRIFKTDTDRNDKSVGIGSSLFYTFNKNSFFLNTEYRHYTSQSSNYQEYTNQKLYWLLIGGNYQLTNSFTLTASYKYSVSDYEDDISTDLNPSTEARYDTYHQLTLKLSKELSPKLALYIENDYSINRSNYLPAEYTKNTIMFGIDVSY
jgi:hypothetical protein